jgi:hypothetical protein
MDDDRAAKIIKRYDGYTSDRGTFEATWEQIALRVLPQYAGSFTSAGMTRTPGAQRTEEMVDATAALALPKFAAAMESMLTPRSQTWHRLEPVDKAMRRNRTVRLYFDEVNDLLFKYRYAPRANYASQQHEVYMGLGAFGTAALYVDALSPRYGRGIRYRAIHLGEIYFDENHQGIIDTALRKFELTARQAYQKFEDTCPAPIIEAAKDPVKCETKFWFIHCVEPRDEAEGYDPNRLDAKGMQYASTYVSILEKKIVLSGGREAGYHTFPYPISRYVVAPGEVYGRSPAMLALPSIKTLNEQKRTVLKQGHRAVDPVLLAHDDGVLGGINMRPGATNYGGVTADGRPLVHALPVGNLSLAKEMMELERNTINDAFLITLFQILVETPQMTATEVLERSREKGALLSPTMGRQQSEALGPMIEREVDVLAAQGLLPPMPPIVRAMNAEFETVYDSPLSRAQRAEKATGFLQAVNWVRDVIAVTQDPSPMDNFNMDVAVPALADISAVPTEWMNDAETVAAIRAGRAKAQQQQQLVDAAPALSSVAKALPQLKLNGQATGAV